MKKSYFLALVISLFLSACSTNGKTVSRKEAQTNSELIYLPLLTVLSTTPIQGGYTAKLTDENKTPFTSTVLKNQLGESYTVFSKGDKVKILGDYTDNDIIEIAATSIVFVR